MGRPKCHNDIKLPTTLPEQKPDAYIHLAVFGQDISSMLTSNTQAVKCGS